MLEIRAACSPGEIRAVTLQDGDLADYAVHRPGASHAAGDRLRGRVIAAVPAMAGAFVALPGGAEGFLPDSHAPAGLTVGAAVTIVITRAGQGGKGPRLSARTPQVGPGPPAMLEPGPGAIQRLLALHPGATVIVDDAAAAIGLGATIVARAWDDAVQSRVDALAHPAMDLPGGLRATVHPTPALVAIDIDQAAATAARIAKPGAQRDANRAALPALARAIRLRNLSGAIVIDLAGMTPKARAALAPDIAAALTPDPLQPRFLGFTALGLAEITRPRVHPPLHELLAGPHAAGLAALRDMLHRCAADPSAPLALHAAPDVVRALDEDAFARADLARRVGRPLMMRSDPALPPGRWTLEPLSRG